MCVWVIVLLLCTYAIVPITLLTTVLLLILYRIYPTTSPLPTTITTLDIVCPCHTVVESSNRNTVRVILAHGTIITNMPVTQRMESLRWARSYVRIYPHLQTLTLYVHHPCPYQRTLVVGRRDRVQYKDAVQQTSKLLRSMVPHVQIVVATE